MASALDELLAAFQTLVAERQAELDDGEDEEEGANFRCVDCVRCTSCRFCTACEDCEDCTYCDACSGCLSCTQCRGCEYCEDCSHSLHSSQCSGGSYLVLCFDCDACVHCFACVGLEGEEFCILNERYARRDYFKKVAELKAELDARALEGWAPPWRPAKPAPAVAVPTAIETDITRPTEINARLPRRLDPSERSWPPIDHASARALDRASAEDAWGLLESERAVTRSRGAAESRSGAPVRPRAEVPEPPHFAGEDHPEQGVPTEVTRLHSEESDALALELDELLGPPQRRAPGRDVGSHPGSGSAPRPRARPSDEQLTRPYPVVEPRSEPTPASGLLTRTSRPARTGSGPSTARAGTGTAASKAAEPPEPPATRLRAVRRPPRRG